MQALGVVHVGGHLLTALHDGLAELLRPYPLLLVEETVEDFVTLLAGYIAEVLAQHVTHQFHLRVHHLAVGLDDV